MLLAVDGINVNKANNNETTPLTIACWNGHLKIVEMLLAVDGVLVNQANNYGFTPVMVALSKSHIDITIQLFQHGISHNNINEWFHINKIKPSGRIALYKYALLLPQQHQPLLDFHACLLSSKNALVPTSSLKVFNTIWTQLIGFKIESFLLPNKQTRRIMLQVISLFNATLNDLNDRDVTQLHAAICLLRIDVDSVRFLLLQEGVLVNTLSQVAYSRPGAADVLRYRSPLYNAEQQVSDGTADDAVSDDEMARRNEVVDLLRHAGGHAREISSEAWLLEQ